MRRRHQARVTRPCLLVICCSAGCLVNALPFFAQSGSRTTEETTSNADTGVEKRQLRFRRWSSWPRKLLEPFASASGSDGSAELFRFALLTDSHLWPPSSERLTFATKSDAQPVRDGQIVAHTPEIFAALLAALGKFAAGGGSFAVHAGDAVCGGNSFHSSARGFEHQLRSVAAAEHNALPRGWPMLHIPGNHDLHPERGGLDVWAATLGNSSGGGVGAFASGFGHGGLGLAKRTGTIATSGDGSGAYYRAMRRDGWRLLLLDSASAVGMDSDGHGRVGGEQLHWLERQLEQASAANEQVIIIAHQLLVHPTDAEGRAHRWFVPQYDLVENANDVLAIIKRYSHIVRLSLHGHVHANSLTHRFGVPFVTTSAADEYPLMWREVIVRPCAVELRTHAIEGLPSGLLDLSAKRDTRGVNEAKLGGQPENHVVLRSRGGGCGRGDR